MAVITHKDGTAAAILAGDKTKQTEKLIEQVRQDDAEEMARIVEEFNSDLANIQEQVDASVSSWFYSVDPTLSNPPAVDWNTDELKAEHVGDLYYNKTNGKGWRWQYVSDHYEWTLVTDQKVLDALYAASKAKDTLDSKRRNFVSTPVPPYDVGDLWSQGSQGDIMRCVTPKAVGQSYALSDWILASKYTDNTRANEAYNLASTAEGKVEGSIKKDTLHYLATDLSAGVTIATPGWSTGVQSINSVNRYLWTYHTYELINGNTTNTSPIITGVYGDKGDPGDPSEGVESIASVTEYYLATSASSGVTRGTSGWTTTIQTMTSTNRYLWNYEVVEGTRGTTFSETDPIIIGTHGANGESVASVTEYYLASPLATGVTWATQGWTTAVQSTDDTNKYLWNYEVTTGTNGTQLSKTMPAIIGTQGSKGDKGDKGDTGATGATGQQGPKGDTGATGAQGPKGDTGSTGAQGVSVTKIQPEYYLSTSSSQCIGGQWSTTLSYSSGYYIWTHEKITYSDGSIDYSTDIYDSALTAACSVSENTAQYFWIKDTGGSADCPTGTYVTEVPRSQYDPLKGGTPTRGSILMRSAALYLRLAAAKLVELVTAGLKVFAPGDETNPVLQALSSGILVGKETEMHIGIDSSNVTYYDMDRPTTKIGPSALEFYAPYGNSNYKMASIQFSIPSQNLYRLLFESGGGNWASSLELNRDTDSTSNTAVLKAQHSNASSKVTVEPAKITARVGGTDSIVSDYNAVTLNKPFRPQTETISLTSLNFTTTTGTFYSAGLKRVGNTMQMNLVVTVNANVNAGSNLYEGTFNLEDYRPSVNVYGVGYYGSSAIVGILRTNGTITLRVTGATINKTTPASNAGVSFTYLI